MCNLYSLNKKRDALAQFFRVSHNRGASFEASSAIFPRHVAPVVRRAADGEREIVTMSWGFMLLQQGKAPRPVTNVRDDKILTSSFWKSSFEERRCLVPASSFVDLIEAGIVKRTMPRDSCSTTNNLWGVRWSKICVNGMRNALSAVTGMNGNERDSHDEVRRISIRLGAEAVRVGQALGYELESMARIPATRFALASDDPSAMSEIEETLIRGTKAAARSNDQRPSMAQDIQRRDGVPRSIFSMG